MVKNFSNWLWRNWKKLLFLTVLVFIVYFNSLGNDFVSDDIAAILNNKNLGDFGEVLSRPLAFVRPLLYFFAYKIGGLNPLPFRMIDLLFHLGNVYLIYILVSRLLNEKVAFWTASLFAAHPVLVESVTWISGGIHGQYAFFILLALFFYSEYDISSPARYEKFLSETKRRWLVFSLLSSLLALASSEKAIILAPLFLLFFLCFKDWRKLWPTLIPFWSIGFLFGILYLGAIGPRLETLQTQFYQPPQTINPLLQIPVAITSYLQLIIFPKDLTLYHSEMVFSQGEYLLRLAVFILFLGLTIWLFFKKRPLSFWPGLFIIGLLPMLTPLGISWIVAERYVYLSSLGILVLIGLLFQKAEKVIGSKTVSVVFAVVLILLSGRTMARNRDWQNQDTLWLATAKTSPSSPQNHNNLGDYYGRQGDLDKAAEEFLKAIELQSNYGDAYHNLANTYGQMGKIDLAIENYQKALEFNPGLWQSRQNLAAIYFGQEKFKEASEEMRKAIEISPANPNLRLVSAIIYLKMGQKNEAQAELKKILELDPENQQAKELLTNF